jgi:hypothetical protein
VWDTDLLLSVITVFPRGLWLIRNFSLVDIYLACSTDSCSTKVMFYQSHVPKSCSTKVMFYQSHVLPKSCSTNVMFYQSHVLPKSCSTKVMFIQSHVLPKSCSTKVMFIQSHVLLKSGSNRVRFYQSPFYLSPDLQEWILPKSSLPDKGDSTKFRSTKVRPSLKLLNIWKLF